MKVRWMVVFMLISSLVVLALVGGCAQGGGNGNAGKEDEESTSLKLEVVEQWAQSAHARPIARGAEEEGCKNCHDGLTFTEAGGGFQPRFGQASEPTRPAEGTTTVEGARDWVVATDCRACHTGVGVEIADKGSIDGIPSLDTAEGGRGALCMACHNGWHAAGPGQEGNAAAPHYSVQADMLFGVNTLPVGAAGGATESEEESISPHAKEVKDTCVGCHVAAGEETNHLFKIEDFSGCEAKDCHDKDMTDGGDASEDYDGDGQIEKATAEVEGLMDKLKVAINTKVGSSEFKSERGDVVFVGGARVATSDPAYAAAYNYLFVQKDKSNGIHNYGFTVRLLQQSLDGVSQ